MAKMYTSAIHVIPVYILMQLLLAYACQQSIFYISTGNTSFCPEEDDICVRQCMNLSTFVYEHLAFIDSNISLVFLPGEHILKNHIEVMDTEEFSMVPYYKENINGPETARIKLTCTYHKHYGGQIISFNNVSHVKIDSISFHSCGDVSRYGLLQKLLFSWGDVSGYGALKLFSVHRCEIINSCWNESRSSAIVIEYSDVVISGCQFMRISCISYCSGGGIFAQFSTVTFSGSNLFDDNVLLGDGGGLFLVDSTIQLEGNLTLAGNWAKDGYGGGVYMVDGEFTTTGSSFLLIDSNRCSPDDAGYGGGGLSFNGVSALIAGSVVFANNQVIFQGEGGGIYMSDSQCIFNSYTTFHNNSAAGHGGGLYVVDGNVVLQDANFTQNSAYFGGALYCARTNISYLGKIMFVKNTASYGALTALLSRLCFRNRTIFARNSAINSGGAVFMTSATTQFKGYVHIVGNTAGKGGGGFCIFTSTITFEGKVDCAENSAENFGGGVDVNSKSLCLFVNTVIFTGNKAGYSGGSISANDGSNITFLSAVQIWKSIADWAGGAVAIRYASWLNMTEATVKDNLAYTYGGAIALDRSVLVITGGSILTNNTAQYGGALHAIASKMYFSGNHSFRENQGQFGGGCSLSDSSLVYCSSEEYTNTIQFVSNYAHQYGGAVWVEDIPFYSCIRDETRPVRMCFFQVDCVLNLHDACLFTFDNNIAMLAGSNLYGGSIDNCLCNPDALEWYDQRTSGDIFNEIFSFKDEPTVSSAVSSDPMEVCLCSELNEPDCFISNYSIEAFSGQDFALALVGVGQRNGKVPAVVRSTTSAMTPTSVVKTTSSNCSVLLYKISTENLSETLTLYPESPCHSLTHTLDISVVIKPCPLGFMLHNETKSCTCVEVLEMFQFQCDINSLSFTNNHGVWIAHDKSQDTLIYHPHCPFDYCKPGRTSFTLNNTNNQCNHNRYGIICGACKEGYSLTFGESKCTQCSHKYIPLFFLLAAAGVALVLFLLMFKLTVSMGTINGLIFFANIVGINPNIFLPPKTFVMFRVFIAWLNLDLGITTCFFDGLDMYINIWLQFVFPLYVWILITIVIFVSRHSTHFTRFLGSDPVAVLATLILLSYTKLFRAILTVMSFTYIQALDGSSIAVWLYDGNIRYLSGKHIPLFIFALLVLLFLFVPYTAILLFAPCLQRYSRKRMFAWIESQRLKPFIRSYYAPLKDKYRSWIGLLLVLRLCLLLVFVSNSLGDPSIIVLAITSTVIFVVSWRVLFGIIYTNWCFDALVLFFIAKLGLFSLFTLKTNINQKDLADTFVAVAFILFITTTVYHGWKQLTYTRWWRHKVMPKWKSLSQRNKDVSSQESNFRCEEPHACVPVPSTFIELRESLLEST